MLISCARLLRYISTARTKERPSCGSPLKMWWGVVVETRALPEGTAGNWAVGWSIPGPSSVSVAGVVKISFCSELVEGWCVAQCAVERPPSLPS